MIGGTPILGDSVFRHKQRVTVLNFNPSSLTGEAIKLDVIFWLDIWYLYIYYIKLKYRSLSDFNLISVEICSAAAVATECWSPKNIPIFVDDQSNWKPAPSFVGYAQVNNGSRPWSWWRRQDWSKKRHVDTLGFAQTWLAGKYPIRIIIYTIISIHPYIHTSIPYHTITVSVSCIMFHVSCIIYHKT